MAPRSKGRQAVYLVQVPAEWRPDRYWSYPPVFSGGELVAKNLTPADAAGHARCHNKAKLERFQRYKQPVESWAIVVRHLKACWHGSRDGAEKGGAA